MLHRLLQTPAPIKRLPSHLRPPDFFRQTIVRFHIDRPLLRILPAAALQMAETEQSTSSKPDVPRAASPSEGTGTARSNVAKTQLTNHPHAMMVSNSVNKTALHPGGVQYDCPSHSEDYNLIMDRPAREHTELEEELHETAHIDYDRVAIVRHFSLPRQYQI